MLLHIKKFLLHTLFCLFLKSSKAFIVYPWRVSSFPVPESRLLRKEKQKIVIVYVTMLKLKILDTLKHKKKLENKQENIWNNNSFMHLI